MIFIFESHFGLKLTIFKMSWHYPLIHLNKNRVSRFLFKEVVISFSSVYLTNWSIFKINPFTKSCDRSSTFNRFLWTLSDSFSRGWHNQIIFVQNLLLVVTCREIIVCKLVKARPPMDNCFKTLHDSHDTGLCWVRTQYMSTILTKRLRNQN